MPTDRLVELKALAAKAPAGPWSYRPDEYDDWGIVRAAPDSEGRKYLICQARAPFLDEDALNQHRQDETDPWEAPAKLIAAIPDMIDLLSTQETTIAELVAALEKARGYVEGNHDEGCELDPEFGRDEFENNRIDDEDDELEYPQDAKCTCGTDEVLLAMETALTKVRSAL